MPREPRRSKRKNEGCELPLHPDLRDAEIEVIVGGIWDSRPQEQWHPEDGLTDTAYGKVDLLGRLQCCAHSKKHKGRCARAPVLGKRVCLLHGGSPNIGRPVTTARYSGVMGLLRERFEEHREDEALLDHRPALALMDTVIEELIQRGMEDRDSPRWRHKAVDLFNDTHLAALQGRQAAFRDCLRKLGNHLTAGAARDQALLDATKLADTRQKRTEAVRKLQLTAAQTMTLNIFVTALTTAAEDMVQEVPVEYRPRVLEAFRKAVMRFRGNAEAMRELTASG